MADDILKKSPSSNPASNTVNDDDDLDLDNVYDLSGGTGGTTMAPTTASLSTPVGNSSSASVAGLTANLSVVDEKLQSFRSQSSGLGEAAQADTQVLADLAAKAQGQQTAVPVSPPTAVSADADVSLDLDKDLAGEGDWLAKLSDALQEEKAIDVKSTSMPTEMKISEPSPKMDVLKSVEPVAMTTSAKEEVIDLDLDDQKLTANLPEIKTAPIKKVDSEATKIEAELEANIIDLDEEDEPARKNADDLFAPSGPVPTLTKVSLSKNVAVTEEKRVAPVQKLMKTDTIFNKGDKNNQLNLNVSPEGKRLKSPVEELAELTLEDWSRKGDIPAERAAKVKEQILALGAKSIINEIEGLNAWRRSEVSQKYLDLGIAAYLSDKSLEEIVAEQKDLNLEEWFIINQLNRELMI
jgi:hypothetical protein